MIVDVHVHVSGRPFFYLDEERFEKLKESLRKNKIDSFVGILSPGTLYRLKEDSDLLYSFFSCFDKNKIGLSKVKELGGMPAIRIDGPFLRQPSLWKDICEIVKKAGEEGIQILKIYCMDKIFNFKIVEEAIEYGIKTILFHTPENFEIISELVEKAVREDLNVILGHGCYKNNKILELMKENSNLFADTSRVSFKNIRYFINEGLEDKLMFGSDWPTRLNLKMRYFLTKGWFDWSSPNTKWIDWNVQKKELKKIYKLGKSLYNKIAQKGKLVL